ncbi:acyl carrier protein, partial [Lecanoromycetidae sp. Uapishka_2]
MRGLSQQLIYMTNLEEAKSRLSSIPPKARSSLEYPRGYSENDIAVVGTSCKVAGADDLEEFWKILCEGKSQHIEVPKERFGFETQWRDVDPKRKWYGNFVRDHDAFDHKFFKKSPREATSQDPQQRLMMQIAYQAVEQSGYFNTPRADKHVGCYIGVCAVDYENNIACYPANAFSATGNLKSFIAGKISHYFGWTGPGLTIDTACSASAVAVHQACKAILHGECTAALAGGTTVMTSPIWFQNLAGASFLSPTGACKPFDAKADGYCRGEGIAAVFLKKMSQAVADGDPIIGCISSTAVYQNENCTPIFVPNSPSLSGLFRNVAGQAGLEPKDITVVEAHGTGTPVGDPAEYESILQVFGGSIRSKPLPIGSVKGHVGHTECASGVIALIKIILMIQESAIPPQASFQSMSPHIKVSPADMMEVVTQMKNWDSDYRAALINNYGASGSNASMVVTQPLQHGGAGSSHIHSVSVKHPFWICGLDERSVREYSVRLKRFIQSRTVNAKNISLANLAFNVYRQSNRTLDKGLIFACGSISELEDKLTAFANGDKTIPVMAKKTSRSVVLCFGGQISTFIGLDRKVYDGVNLLRNYLDQCHSVLESIGLSGIYPEIFQRTPIADTVKLQTMLFALQYSCAKAWIDSGVQIAAVIGHSFGELTALCISGVLPFKDTIKTIADRARLVRDRWGTDSGAMLAVEADLDDVHRLLNLANDACRDERPATIACYNGPRNFTLAGATKAVDAVAESASSFPGTRVKRLKVTNAFHSTLVEPLMADLAKLGDGLTFSEPTIPWERATESNTIERLGRNFFAEHMRNPVHFNHALQRLWKQYPSCIWLEAGSSSTLTTMASRALESSSNSHFQAVNITNDNGLQNLVDTTLSLWKEGLTFPFWAHHSSQTYEYSPLLLPPYQFEKNRHWLDLKKPQKAMAAAPASQAQVQPEEELPKGLYTFVGYQDSKQQSARFRINTMTKKYEEFVSGHFIAQTAAICPATLEVDMAIEALLSLRADFAASNLQPQIHSVDNQAPICVDSSRAVWLDLEAMDADFHIWVWKIVSTGTKGSAATLHVTGKILFRSVEDPQYQAEFARYTRFVGHERCLRVLNCPDADDIIQGRNIYKTFAEIVDYGEKYRGLQKLVGKGNESAGRVVKQRTGETWLDTHLSDCFSQVGGIWVNCMTDRATTDMYIANGFEQWVRSPQGSAPKSQPSVWDVFAYHYRESDKAYVTDIFIFDSSDGALTEVILGINYARVPKLSMSKILGRMTADSAQSAVPAAAPSAPVNMKAPPLASDMAPPPSAKSSESVKVPKPKKEKKAKSDVDFLGVVTAVLADLSGLDLANIKPETQLADIGIDSLMGMELAHELEEKFKCSVAPEQLVEVTTCQSLVQCVQSIVGPTDGSATTGKDESDDSDEESDDIKPSSGSQSVDNLSDSNTSISSMAKMNLAEYLADFLGIGENDVVPDVLLRDLGVDSLLSTELRSDIADKTDVHIPEDITIEELTIKELDAKINGQSGGSPTTASEIPKETTRENLPPVNGTTSAIGHGSTGTSTSGDLNVPSWTISEAFGETKILTDQFIADYRCADYLDIVNPKQTQLCVALTVEAFEQLGCHLRTANAGQKLDRIKYLPQHSRLAEYLYDMLEKEARLIDVDGDQITRTAIAPPEKSSKDLLENLMRSYPDHGFANKLTYFTGTRLADVMTGKSDGIKLIFGTEEGRELVSGLYGDSLLNRLAYKQMEDFLKRLISKLPMHEGPLKILEMGAGTGGTTKYLVPLLASLNVPVEYTFTDLAPSFVAAARKKFKAYPFMKFRAHDIEKAPEDDLCATQHIIIASNAVHATHSLTESTKNIRKALRPDGFLMMLEMTETLYWIDMIFGLLEGWWLFDDGRRHAISHQSRWERDLQSVGYGHVDWTDGNRPENKTQRIIVALASGPRYDRLPIPPEPAKSQATDSAARQVIVDEYVRKSTQEFSAPIQSNQANAPAASEQCVMVTGATGSLGSHLIAYFAELPDVKAVICLNRHSRESGPGARQQYAMESRGIKLDQNAHSKIRAFATDTSKPLLGLPHNDYAELLSKVTHVLHNAWPMSGTRPVKGFELQFKVMRNLIDLTRDISCNRKNGSKVSFQLISSIATVGHYPLWSGNVNVPEERMTTESVLPNGYGDAKYVCEKMLDETLHRYPDHFRAMAVRLGQVAGSKTSGYWNPMEHLAFLIKSSQTLAALPDFDGVLSWTPVNDVAATLGDLLLSENSPYPIYHIDNPVRQPWRDMIPVLADALNIPRRNTIPFEVWVRRVRNFPGSVEMDNPAAKLVEFLDGNFVRMSCGGLLLDTAKSREHSKTLANVGPVSDDIARGYIQAWKEMGFLR